MMKVVVTGPESCGKTELCQQLAEHFNAQWIPEYARGYVERLSSPYTYDDVEQIALKQVELYHKAVAGERGIVIFDTFLIITKIWFKFVYKRCPEWLDNSIKELHIDLFLLCEPDLPWQADPVRENGHIREELFKMYQEELEYYGFKYQIVKGFGEERVKLAKQHINQQLQKPNYDRVNRFNSQEGD